MKKYELRQVNSPVYRYWEALYRSFYSARFYIDVAKRWKGYGFLYLLFIFCFGTIPIAMKLSYEFNKVFYQKVLEPIEKLPLISIQNGKVSLDESLEQPYLVKNSHGDIISVVDTSNGLVDPKKKYPKAVFIVQSDRVLIHLSNPYSFMRSKPVVHGEYTEYKLDKNTNEIFSAKDWLSSIRIIYVKWLIEFLIYPVLTLLLYAIGMVGILSLGCLGQAYALALFGLRLKFKTSTRLFSVSMTPALIVFFFLMGTGVSYIYSGLIIISLVAAYYTYAMISLKLTSKILVRT